ncbi:MAG: discoidin domain-containing protein [Fibrobacterales bacterium]
MKQKSNSFWVIYSCAVALSIVFYFIYTARPEVDGLTKATETTWPQPLPAESEEDRERYGDHKRRPWTKEEAAFNKKRYEDIRSPLSTTALGAPAPVPTLESLAPAEKDGFINLANNTFSGKWTSRGPKNMPGAFQFSEIDEGTDTVYAVSMGHYGGVQFIYKGTLAGDDWKIINPKHPSRFEDLMVVPNGSQRRIIAGEEQGAIMYSDNAGAAWTFSTGITNGITSTIVNRQDNHTIYTTDGKSIYVSYDLGSTFSLFQSFTINTHARLYTPRWDIQPNASDVYFAHGSTFYTLNSAKTSFVQTGTIASGAEIGLGGDTRRLWMTQDSKEWYHSVDGGATWNYQATENWWYSSMKANMSQGQYPGIHPENPDIIIGGYAFPLSSRNAGQTTNSDAKNWWGHYQNAVGNDQRVRIHFHPDHQASQFFYDASGTLLSLRSTDGGVFKSYNEWTKTSYPTLQSIEDVFYNITLFNAPTQEAYRGGFISGKHNSDDMTACTQDQGWQNTRASTYGTDLLSWDQVGGGDGPNCISGDGLIAWSYNYQGSDNFKRIELYDASGTYKGLSGATSSTYNPNYSKGTAYFTPGVGDWSNGDLIWTMSHRLRKFEYNGGVISSTEHDLNESQYFVQGIAQSRENPDIVFAMENGYVYTSTNRGDSWSQVASNSATGISGTHGIGRGNFGMGWAIDNQTILFATESGSAVHTIFSKDGGYTWTNVTGTGINSFPSASVNGMTANEAGTLIFASTTAGPYVFVVAEEHWYPLALQGSVPIFSGQVATTVKKDDSEIIRFSTWGQGIWDLTLAPVIPTLDITSTTPNVLITTQDSITLHWSSNQLEYVIVTLNRTDSLPDTLGIAATQTGSFTWPISDSLINADSFSLRIQHSVSLTYDETEVYTIIPPDVNIALNKESIVSSTNEADSNSFVNDGDSDNYWRSDATTSDQWVAIDLEDTFHIGVIVIEWGAILPETYTIEMYDDSSNWIALTSDLKPTNPVDILNLNTGFTNGIRIRSTHTELNASAIVELTIHEIRIYENQNPILPLSSSEAEELSSSSSGLFDSSIGYTQDGAGSSSEGEFTREESSDEPSPISRIVYQKGLYSMIVNTVDYTDRSITVPESVTSYEIYTIHGERIKSGTVHNGTITFSKDIPQALLFIQFNQ